VKDIWVAVRFLLLGGVAAGVNWLSRFAWETIMPFGAAVVAAYATGMVVAFILFRLFVFPNGDQPMGRQIRNFVLVNLVGMALSLALAVTLVEWVFPAVGFDVYPKAIGHGLAIAAPILSSWFGHKYFTFARRADRAV